MKAIYCPGDPVLDGRGPTGILPVVSVPVSGPMIQEESSIIKKHGAYFPHWRRPHGTYFVTFRLWGSVPKFLAERREARRQEIMHFARCGNRELSDSELDELEELHFEEVRLRRHDLGMCWLKDDRIAEIVANALRYHQDQRYILFAWCIMSNHLHAVVHPLPGYELSNIMHSWKSFTAKKANRLLGRSGPFWQTEYYDSLVRNTRSLWRCMEYTWQNPEKAGIKDWKWRGMMDMEKAMEFF